MELYYKDDVGMVHVIEEGFEHLLEKNFPSRTFTQITKEEVDALRVPLTPPIPEVVSMRQARLAMLSGGILATVDAVIAAMGGPEGDAARIEWEFAQEVKRDWPLVVQLTGALGMTEAQVDAMFILAASL